MRLSRRHFKKEFKLGAVWRWSWRRGVVLVLIIAPRDAELVVQSS